MTNTATSGIPPAYVQAGLKAFGPITDIKRGPGGEAEAAAKAITAVFGSIKDRRQVLAAVRAYRRYYGLRSDEGLMRLMLEAARDWQPTPTANHPEFTGRDYSTGQLTGHTTEDLESAAFEKAASAFGHRRLQVSTHYTICDAHGAVAEGTGRKLSAATIVVHELAAPDPDA